jgi:hypothetical protein
MKDITIDVGVDTAIEIDLQNTGASVATPIVFTIKNAPFARTEAIVKREFTSAAVHPIYITPEESLALLDNAEYDFSKRIVDDKGVTRLLKITDNGKIRLRKGVGGGIG